MRRTATKSKKCAGCDASIPDHGNRKWCLDCQHQAYKTQHTVNTRNRRNRLKMANVFEGKPDARQSDDVNLPVSRFRPTYRALTDREKFMHDTIKELASLLEERFNDVGAENLKAGRHIALAMTKLEEAIMWAIKGLTA